MKPSLLALLAVAACSGVQVPEDSLYRLHAPAPAPAPVAAAGVLRVERPQLAAELQGDALMVAEGPVRVSPYRFHRWAGALDALVGDLLVTGLQRSRSFEQVLGAGDPGHADLVLVTRLLECHQRERPDGWVGSIALDVRLLQADGRVVFQQELTAAEPAENRHPEAVVAALSRAFGRALDEFVARAQQAIGAGALAPAPGR